MHALSRLKPAGWGAAAGAAALAIVGFTWGGWVTGASAELKAKQRADLAVVTALVPVCVDKFRRHADASVTLDELNKMDLWQRASFIEQGGWATMPGGSRAPDAAVARGCAERLGRAQS